MLNWVSNNRICLQHTFDSIWIDMSLATFGLLIRINIQEKLCHYLIYRHHIIWNRRVVGDQEHNSKAVATHKTASESDNHWFILGGIKIKTCRFCGSPEAECYVFCECARCKDPLGYRMWMKEEPIEYDMWVTGISFKVKKQKK